MKICMPCFRKRFGDDAKPLTMTWGRQCDACKKPTPSLSTLVKVDR